MNHAVSAKNLNSTRKHKLNFPLFFFVSFNETADEAGDSGA